MESKGLTLHGLNPATDGDEWSGLGPACFTLMERARDTHRLFFRDTFIILSSHLCLFILGFTGQNSICIFYSLHVCLMFHPFHLPCHHPNTSIRLYGSMNMNVGWKSGLWYVYHLPWKSGRGSLFVNGYFFLSHSVTDMLILVPFSF